MWYDNCVFYQIYPLGFCGAPDRAADGPPIDRLKAVEAYIPQLQKLGIGAVLLNPVFASSTHGYDTVDLNRIDSRLGTDEDFARVCAALHAAGMRVVLDAVFNHVGRDFFAFRDVLENRRNSVYKDWFFCNFDSDNAYGDGFYYEGWEGHYELVKLNLSCRAVREYLFAAVRGWVERFGADGLRLDVCYLLPDDFLRELRSVCDAAKPEFYLVGEVIHGDPKRFIGGGTCNAVTNYECYKGLYSSLNACNFFEIAHSLKRLFGSEPWAVCRGANPLNFADNHDVTRALSSLTDKRNIFAMYALLFCMPGTPCLYYGSEWGCEGHKSAGDKTLRPDLPAAKSAGRSDIFAFLTQLSAVKKACRSLACGSIADAALTNKTYVFVRAADGEKIACAVSCDDTPQTLYAGGRIACILAGEGSAEGDRILLPAHGAAVLKLE